MQEKYFFSFGGPIIHHAAYYVECLLEDEKIAVIFWKSFSLQLVKKYFGVLQLDPRASKTIKRSSSELKYKTVTLYSSNQKDSKMIKKLIESAKQKHSASKVASEKLENDRQIGMEASK